MINHQSFPKKKKKVTGTIIKSDFQPSTAKSDNECYPTVAIGLLDGLKSGFHFENIKNIQV
jgi:hypothetical protein